MRLVLPFKEYVPGFPGAPINATDTSDDPDDVPQHSAAGESVILGSRDAARGARGSGGNQPGSRLNRSRSGR